MLRKHQNLNRLQVIMTEWKEYKLGEACDILTGFSFKGDEYESVGNLKVVRGENVTRGTLRWDNEKHWNHSTAKLEKYFLEEGDIVIGMDGSRVGQNRAIIRREELPLILAQRVAKISAKKDFNQVFLWYHIFSDSFKKYVDSIHTGTSIPHISQNQIADFEILAPSYEEQQAIASVLSSLDNKIDLLHRQNQTLEAMAETLFRQWFIEEAEESWKKGKVGDLFTLQRGFDLPSQNRTHGKYPIFSASGINGYHTEYKVKAPCVTTGRSGLIGKVFYIMGDSWPLNTSLFISEFKIGTPLFSYFLLKTLDLETLNAGSAVPSLNRNDVHSLDLSIPPKEKIKQFEDFGKPLFEKLNQNTHQINTLTQLRDTLLPKLMSGEVRVEM